MTDQTLYPSKDLPLDEFGILGVGSFVFDYFIDEAMLLSHPEVKKVNSAYVLDDCTGIKISDIQGNSLQEYRGMYTPDLKQPRWKWNIGEKHTGGDLKNKKTLEFILGQNVSIKPGGGIINFARAWLAHSSEIPIGITVLRGKGKREELLQGAFFNFIDANESYDPGNMVVEPRTIIRGKPLTFSNNLYFNPQFPFNIGTIVINSLESEDLTKSGIEYYLNQRRNGHYVGGIIAITPKMKKSYGLIANQAIPNRFVPIFSPTDLISYAYRGTKKGNKKKEEDFTYTQIFHAIKRVRAEQGDRPQRIYVTLGPYGAIAVGTSGSVYRLNIFNIKGNNFTGAGDVASAAISRFEHRKNLSLRAYLPAYSVLCYASAASAIHIDGLQPSMGAIYNKLMSEGKIEYETLGPLHLIKETSLNLRRKLKDVGNGPLSGRYDTIRFKN